MSVMDCENVILTCPEVAEKLDSQQICLIPQLVGNRDSDCGKSHMSLHSLLGNELMSGARWNGSALCLHQYI